MAFYFSSDTKALYDTDVFPVASLPANKVEINEETYTELLTKQNQGYVIKADNSGNPYAVAQGEASATDMKHSGSIATTVALGHVKVGNTMKADSNGVLDVKENAIAAAQIADGSITTPKLADGAVTTAKIENGAVTEEKLYAVKDLLADETSLTMAETANEFTLSVKDGGISRNKIADAAIGESKIDEYAVTSTKINPGAVISSKIAEGAVGTNALANGAVTNAKIADEAITYSKIAPELRQSVLDFRDTNDDELNGQEWGHTFSTAQENPRIGNVPNNRIGRLIDFTLSFEFTIPQATIGSRTAFEIIVWRGDSMTTNTIYDRRTIYVTAESPFVHERFSFITNGLPEIKINFGQVDALSRVALKNIQLRGFGIL